MVDGIKISDLNPSLTPGLDYSFPAIRNGVTERLSIQQVSELILALVVDGSPDALNTLDELAAALGDDENYAATVTTALAARLKLDGSNAMTGPLDLGGNDVQNAANFVGMIGDFLSTSPPPGWLVLNGAEVSRTTYAALWAFAQSSGMLETEANWLGGAFGQFSDGDGSTTFRLPDHRGEFSRALDGGRGVDVSRALGSLQADSLKSHNHRQRVFYSGTESHIHGGSWSDGGAEASMPNDGLSGSPGHTETPAGPKLDRATSRSFAA